MSAQYPRLLGLGVLDPGFCIERSRVDESSSEMISAVGRDMSKSYVRTEISPPHVPSPPAEVKPMQLEAFSHLQTWEVSKLWVSVCFPSESTRGWPVREVELTRT